MRSKLLLLMFLLPNLLFSEGSNEIYVNRPTANTMLYLCSDFAGQCGSAAGIRTQFAVYECNEEDRLYFEVINDEIVYFGLRGDPSGSNRKIVYRISDVLGNIVFAEADIPTAGTGFISTIDQARVGPNQISGGGGYDAIEFRPPAPGSYFIEFDRIHSTNGNREPGAFYINLFDITVYDTIASEIRPGRLHSKGWQFIEESVWPGWKKNSATFYIYSTDSIITSVEFDEMEGRAWIMFCNQFGCQKTGDFVIDRMSIPLQQAYVPEYRIFVNVPDSNLFPPATTPGMIIPPDPWAESFCDGTVIFHVTVDKPGNVDILLELPPPFIERNIGTTVVTGENLITWDGLDGAGVPVTNNTTLNFTVTYINGLTNLPLYDIEYNVNGFRIELIAPTGTTPLLYWDDRNIPGGTINLAGCNSVLPNPGCHSWTTLSYGDQNTINSWWYTASNSTVPVNISHIRAPGLLTFNQAPQSYCAGEFGVYISVDADPNADEYHWSYTGTGATITHADPSDNFITIDFSLAATPGFIEVYGSNSNCGDGPVNTLQVAIAPVPDGEISVNPNDTVCVNELVSFSGINNNAANIQSWQWNFGDGNTATGQNVTHIYTTPLNAIVRLILTTNQGCIDTASFALIVVDPTISFSATPNPSCVGDTVWFNGIGDASFTEWQWDFGDGNTAIGQNTWHIYTGNGLFGVTLNVCSKNAFDDQLVNPLAEADAGSDEIICEHYSHDFSNSSVQPSAVSYDSLLWTGGAGTYIPRPPVSWATSRFR